MFKIDQAHHSIEKSGKKVLFETKMDVYVDICIIRPNIMIKTCAYYVKINFKEVLFYGKSP